MNSMRNGYFSLLGRSVAGKGQIKSAYTQIYTTTVGYKGFTLRCTYSSHSVDRKKQKQKKKGFMVITTNRFLFCDVVNCPK